MMRNLRRIKKQKQKQKQNLLDPKQTRQAQRGCLPVIPALWRLRQKTELKAILVPQSQTQIPKLKNLSQELLPPIIAHIT